MAVSPYFEGGVVVKKEDIIAISNMRSQGKSAAAIAESLDLSINTVKSYLRRHPEMENSRLCPQCGKPVLQQTGRKEKKFCSDRCRNSWWNHHPAEINRKAYYTLVCQCCGKEFECYGNQKRKFCSRECYKNHRRKNGKTIHSGQSDAVSNLPRPD